MTGKEIIIAFNTEARLWLVKCERRTCESNVKINGRNTRIAVYYSAYPRVTLACVVVRPDIQQRRTT